MEQVNRNINYVDKDIELMTDMRTLSYLDERNPSAYVLISCQQGVIQFRFNGTPIQLKSRMSFVCPPNNRITNVLLSPDAIVAVLKMSTRMVQELMSSRIDEWNKFFYVNQYNLSISTDEHLRQMKFYIDLINSKASMESTPYHKEIMQSILRAVLFEILSLIKQSKQAQSDASGMSRSKYHFTQFLELLSATPVKHKPVEYYADQLCISSKYLSAVCKECSNKSARQWIYDMKNEDIRYNLVSTNLSIKEIANKLGYEDFSFFCKYVRRHFGCSPTELRKQNQSKNNNNDTNNHEELIDNRDENP
ncbi:MAG: helix-turn-helix domain-containing protein [Bacteroides sp.]|nr:helix-turn-helix domain-containing protein [Bacteroides sp.]